MLTVIFELLLSFQIISNQAVIETEGFVDPIEGENCLQADEAARKIKSWAKRMVEEEEENYSIEVFDNFVSVYKNDDGVTWQIVSDGLQGAFYFAKDPAFEDDYGSGNGVYLYPDYFTAVLGTWKKHLLINGRTTRLRRACEEGGVWKLEFEEPSGPNLNYSPPNHRSLGLDPLQRDPYEELVVNVKKSLIEGASDGIFTKKNVETGTL